MNAVDPDHPAQLLVNDNHSGRTFLIDTGAQVSLLPATAHARRHPSPTAPKLVAANGSSIASYGTQQTHVQLGKRKFTVTFIIADVRRPILGADFLRRHKLLVGQKHIDAHSFQSYACAATNNDLCVSPVATVDSNHYKQCLLQQYPELLRPTFHAARPSHDVSHYITTDGPPVHCKTRRLPPDMLAIAKAEFLEMEKMGIIRKSKSPWSSALHMVPKGKGWRPCGDYRRLNAATVPLQMTSDRGRQFISSLWTEMARSLGTQLHRTTSYHPQANGMVERFHRSLKASLRARLHDGNWIDELPWVLLGLRTATKEDLQTSPAEMVFGDSPLLPGEFASSGKTPFFPSFTQTSTTSPQHHRVDTPTPLATLARSKYVFVRVGPQHPSLQRQGPFKVIQTGNKTFKVLMNKGPQTISVDRLKPAKVSPQTQTRAGRIVNEPDRWHY